MKITQFHALLIFLLPILAAACNEKSKAPSRELISQLHLKTGDVISCGAPDKEFGTVVFPISSDKRVQENFNVALELLHSFEYDEAEKMFGKIVSEAPNCAMAYWGIAMCNYHPLW